MMVDVLAAAALHEWPNWLKFVYVLVVCTIALVTLLMIYTTPPRP